MYMGCIYVRTNLINGKQYVGQAKDFKQRENEWRCLKHHYAGVLINNAREKYGLSNWKVNIVRECNTQDELNRWEMYYIEELKTKTPNGYNLTDGGETSSGYKRTNESIERSKYYGMYESTFRKTVLQYDLDGNFVKEWISASACKREGGYNQGAVSECCRGDRRRYKNFMWKYKENDEIPPKIEPYNTELTHKLKSDAQKGKKQTVKQRMKRAKPIYQCDMDGNIIKWWFAANEAAKQLGIFQSNIWHVLNGNKKTAGGFKWKYAD